MLGRQYGYPLIPYGKAVRGAMNVTNVIGHKRELADAQSKSVVKPNIDTLYSIMFYDISQDDLELTVPELKNRYWLFSFYDLFGNNYANIGSLHGFQQGKFRIRYATQSFGTQEGNITDGFQAYVNSPTPYGLMLMRVAVYSVGTDYPIIHAFQDATNVTKIPWSLQNSRVHPFNLTIFSDPRYNPDAGVTSLAESVLRLTALLSPSNLPRVLQDRPWVADTLALAGIRDGKFTQPVGTSLSIAAATADASAAAILSTAGFVQQLGNNWTQPAGYISGDFFSYYQARHFISLNGYLQLTADEALYPRYASGPSNPGFEIKADEALIFTFSSVPQMLPTGFWSLTAYGEDQFLIPNPLNRYGLGSKDNLTFSDGTLVSNTTTRSFEILVQPGDIPPPQNWTSNWLPGPSGGGSFVVTLRFYGAGLSLANGSYTYPLVTKVKAFT
ncbi:hypothetical protein GQ53DRAFT_635751 [Thozetella sp. PMI_491]|nr:hypothetical protein GQ53DRAFT_635751 [Thozetella sp. PMI_491]